MIDVAAARADTRGCEDLIHLNNCGSALPPRQVVDAMVDYLRQEEVTGGYEVAAARLDDLDLVYSATADYLNCDPTEVAFTVSAGDAWWRAFSAVTLEPGDRVLVGRSEYQANAFGWLQARDLGVIVDIIPNDENGEFDLDAFDQMLDERVKLLSLTMISLANGAVQPVAAVGDRLKASGSEAIYLIDACQAAGQLPLNVDELKCDFLLYTGRKFMRGPRGTGVLYARSSVLDRLGPSPFIDGRSAIWTSADSYELMPDARRFEFGEFGYGGKVGLGVATTYMLDLGIGAIADRVGALSDSLRQSLGDIDGIKIYDEGTQQCGIVTFGHGTIAATEIHAAIAAAGINAGVPLRSFAQLDLGPRGIDELVRVGIHYYNTEAEIAMLLEVVDSVIRSRGNSK